MVVAWRTNGRPAYHSSANQAGRVLSMLDDLLQDSNYHTLRFNSRGVGKSSGRASLTGLSEGKDLEAIVQWGLQNVNNVNSVVIVGYSHGSLIASLHPVLEPPIQTSHILISYPLGARGLLTLFHTRTYASKLKQLLKHDASNVLVIFGDSDEFTNSAAYRTWRRELEQEVEGERKETKLTVVEVKSATHFWRGTAGEELERTVGTWIP